MAVTYLWSPPPYQRVASGWKWEDWPKMFSHPHPSSTSLCPHPPLPSPPSPPPAPQTQPFTRSRPPLPPPLPALPLHSLPSAPSPHPPHPTDMSSFEPGLEPPPHHPNPPLHPELCHWAAGLISGPGRCFEESREEPWSSGRNLLCLHKVLKKRPPPRTPPSLHQSGGGAGSASSRGWAEWGWGGAAFDGQITGAVLLAPVL